MGGGEFLQEDLHGFESVVSVHTSTIAVFLQA